MIIKTKTFIGFMTLVVICASTNPKFLLPDKFTCGTLDTLTNHIKGYPIVHTEHNNMVSECILSEKWRIQNLGAFNFSRDPSKVNFADIDRILPQNITLFTVDSHDQELALFSKDWNMMPKDQLLVLTYSNSMASLCHPEIIQNEFYCFDSNSRNVTLCKQLKNANKPMSFLFSFKNAKDWNLYATPEAVYNFSPNVIRTTINNSTVTGGSGTGNNSPSILSAITNYDQLIDKETQNFGTDHFIPMNLSDPHPCVPRKSSANKAYVHVWLISIFCLFIISTLSFMNID